MLVDRPVAGLVDRLRRCHQLLLLLAQLRRRSSAAVGRQARSRLLRLVCLFFLSSSPFIRRCRLLRSTSWRGWLVPRAWHRSRSSGSSRSRTATSKTSQTNSSSLERGETDEQGGRRDTAHHRSGSKEAIAESARQRARSCSSAGCVRCVVSDVAAPARRSTGRRGRHPEQRQRRRERGDSRLGWSIAVRLGLTVCDTGR